MAGSNADARSWSERTVFVTGGARGIGSDYVRAFCERGARVVIADIVAEMETARVSERQGRLIDTDEAASMEKKKREGYF